MKLNEISFHHMRNVGRGKKHNYTLAMLMTTSTVFVGIAKCSKLDSFVKAKGRLISEGRARKAKELAQANKTESARDYVKWSVQIDREAFGLTTDLIKREVIAICETEISEINSRESLPQIVNHFAHD